MKSIRKNIFVYCLNDRTLLINVARIWCNSPKIRALWLSQNGAFISISMLSTKSVPNFKALQCTNLKAAQCKIPPGMLKTPKPEIGSVCKIWSAMLVFFQGVQGVGLINVCPTYEINYCFFLFFFIIIIIYHVIGSVCVCLMNCDAGFQ